MAGGLGLRPALAGGDVLPGLQDGPGHGKPPALVLGEPPQAAAHGQFGLCLSPISTGESHRPPGPGPAPEMVPPNGKAVPRSSDTEFSNPLRLEFPLPGLSPGLTNLLGNSGMTHVCMFRACRVLTRWLIPSMIHDR